MAEAGLSRGSVLHQFPNRVALMVATAERAMRRVMDSAGVMAAAIEDPFERLSDYARISWETHSAPEGLALTDILLAARWDAELIAGLQPSRARSSRRSTTSSSSSPARPDLTMPRRSFRTAGC